jgi:sulfopyruvate decarboxylase TPP-binding subunit
MSLYEEFRSNGFDFIVGVPCSGLKEFISDLQQDKSIDHIPAPREEVALALAVGAYLAGRKPLVYLQTSGLGYIVNPITSLLKPYGIRIHLLISRRTAPEEHVEMARITRDLLKLLEYDDYTIVDTGGGSCATN